MGRLARARVVSSRRSFILAIGVALSVVIRVAFCAIGSDPRNLLQENAFSPIVHREP